MSKYSDPITATGSLITFDAPSGGIFDSLSVPIAPTQDLHGYSHPWPAGGGVNKLKTTDITAGKVAFGLTSAISGEYVRFTGTCSSGGSHTWKFATVNADQRTLVASLNLKGFVISGGSGLVITAISYNAADYTFRISMGGLVTNTVYDFTVGIVAYEGSTAPTSWTPYSNICPISGLTGLSVYVSPTQDQDDATVYNVDWTTQAGTVYGGTLDVVTGVLTVDRVCETITKDSAWFSFSTGTGNSSAAVYLEYYNNCKYVDGSSSRNGAISSTGKETGNYWINARQNEVPEWDMCFAYSYTGFVRFHRTDVANITDLNAFKAAFPDTQICYYLATPLTYQLTPQEVEALVGTNNVWVDTSAVITLIYRLLQVDRQTDRTSIGKRAESLNVLGKFSSISKVEVNVTENLFYEAGDSSGRTLTVDCPFGTQAMANNLLAMLQGYVYQPFEARRSIANPATELGDGVTVGDVYGGIYAIYHKCGPLHLADLSAPADEEIDHEYKFTPAAERKIERRLNNMESELSVQAGEISAKVDRQGGDPSSVSWKMDADVFKVAVDGSDVLTVNENGLTVDGDGNFRGNVYAGNIQYGGSAGTMSGNGITSRSIGTGRLTSGINTSLGNADYSADVFSGAVVARFTKANVMMTTAFTFNQRAMKLNTRTVKDGSGNNVTIQYLGAY